MARGRKPTGDMDSKPRTEVEVLSAALGSVEDPFAIRDLMKRPVDELADEVDAIVRYSAACMLNAGRYYTAIKEKLPHGSWEAFMSERRWSPTYVRGCMNFLEVIVLFPEAIHLPPGRTTKILLQLPMPKIESVLKDAPAETVKNLTPWDLVRISNKHKKPHKGNDKTKTIVAPEGADEQRWTDFSLLHSEAIAALAALADAKIDPRWYDRIFKLELVQKLGKIYSEVVEKMHPVEEVNKRRITKHAPGYARDQKRSN
jgi:hypothetical protein